MQVSKTDILAKEIQEKKPYCRWVITVWKNLMFSTGRFSNRFKPTCNKDQAIDFIVYTLSDLLSPTAPLLL